MLAPMTRLTKPCLRLARLHMVGSVRNSGGGGVPGSNLPFDINNRIKLTVLMAVFFSTGIGFPFIILRHQLLKNQ